MQNYKIKLELLALAIGFIIVGFLTSQPLNLDLSKTVSDWSQMGIKIPLYVFSGGVILALGGAVAKKSKEWARMICTGGFYLMLNPLLALVSAVENVSGLLAVGSIASLCCFAYLAADLITNRLGMKSK